MLIERLVHAYLRRGIRGGGRIARLAARHVRAFQRLRIDLQGSPAVFVDLRIPGMVEHFANSPYAEPPWEAEQQVLMRRLAMPGDVAYDVGANIGLHTVFLSALLGPEGHVHAFEANPELYATLRATVAALDNVSLHEFGLWERDELRMLLVPASREMASLGAWTGEEATALPCELRSLAGLVGAGTIPPPDFMKCDIEGAELMMLRGAMPLLDTVEAPIVLCEANSRAARALGYVSSEIPRLLASLAAPGYSIFIEETPSRWERAGSAIPELNQYVLAVPEARLGRWPGLANSHVISIDNRDASLS